MTRSGRSPQVGAGSAPRLGPTLALAAALWAGSAAAARAFPGAPPPIPGSGPGMGFGQIIGMFGFLLFWPATAVLLFVLCAGLAVTITRPITKGRFDGVHAIAGVVGAGLAFWFLTRPLLLPFVQYVVVRPLEVVGVAIGYVLAFGLMVLVFFRDA